MQYHSKAFIPEKGQIVYLIASGNAARYTKELIFEGRVTAVKRKYFYVLSTAHHRVLRFALGTNRYTPEVEENSDYAIFPDKEMAQRDIDTKEMLRAMYRLWSGAFRGDPFPDEFIQQSYRLAKTFGLMPR